MKKLVVLFAVVALAIVACNPYRHDYFIRVNNQTDMTLDIRIGETYYGLPSNPASGFYSISPGTLTDYQQYEIGNAPETIYFCIVEDGETRFVISELLEAHWAHEYTLNIYGLMSCTIVDAGQRY